MTFRDHFSVDSSDYARFRPEYPERLFDHLAAAAPSRRLAWDCATGSGQAAAGLASRFERVVATDASVAQLAAATARERVHYYASCADESALAAASCDLIAVAQALHWLPVESFFEEVRRVAAPGGVIAAWTYLPPSFGEPALDATLSEFYRSTIGPYWPPERRLVEDGYASVPFPFSPLEAPPLELELDWDLKRFLGYVGTWSAVLRYAAERGEDPVALLAGPLAAAWGGDRQPRRVTWQLVLRVGRVSD